MTNPILYWYVKGAPATRNGNPFPTGPGAGDVHKILPEKSEPKPEDGQESGGLSSLGDALPFRPPVHRMEETKMADFVQTTTVKTATRKLAAPIADVAAYGHARTVGHHRQPVCMCSLYDRRGEPPGR